MASSSLFLLIVGLVASANSMWHESSFFGVGFGGGGSVGGSFGGDLDEGVGGDLDGGVDGGFQLGPFIPEPRDPLREFSPFLRDAVDLYRQGYEFAPNFYVRPIFFEDDIDFGVGIRFEFKRSVSQPKKEAVFSLLDIDGNGSLCVEEWHAHKGGVVNFASFLKAVDDDGNEEVSWTEFQTVKGIHTKDTTVQSTQAPE